MEDSDTCSRIIVKNLPKHFTEDRLREHFSKMGGGSKDDLHVTDARIMKKGGKSRQFGFVGFKSQQHAKAALAYFSGTYIDTSKIEVSYAKK